MHFILKNVHVFLVEEEVETTTPAAPAARAGIPGANVFIKLSLSLKIYSGVRGSSKKLLVDKSKHLRVTPGFALKFCDHPESLLGTSAIVRDKEICFKIFW